MYPHTENEAASLRHLKLRALTEKGQKLQITSSIIVTRIPIKSLRRNCHRYQSGKYNSKSFAYNFAATVPVMVN